jgi:hypothetical protein
LKSMEGLTAESWKEEPVGEDVFQVKSRKRAWTSQEDQLLRTVVAARGAKDWSSIALSFNGRGGKQCR